MRFWFRFSEQTKGDGGEKFLEASWFLGFVWFERGVTAVVVVTGWASSAAAAASATLRGVCFGVVAHAANVLGMGFLGLGARRWRCGAASCLAFPKRTEKAPRGQAIACSFHRRGRQAGRADAGGGSKSHAMTPVEESRGRRRCGARIAFGLSAYGA